MKNTLLFFCMVVFMVSSCRLSPPVQNTPNISAKFTQTATALSSSISETISTMTPTAIPVAPLRSSGMYNELKDFLDRPFERTNIYWSSVYSILPNGRWVVDGDGYKTDMNSPWFCLI